LLLLILQIRDAAGSGFLTRDLTRWTLTQRGC